MDSVRFSTHEDDSIIDLIQIMASSCYIVPKPEAQHPLEGSSTVLTEVNNAIQVMPTTPQRNNSILLKNHLPDSLSKGNQKKRWRRSRRLNRPRHKILMEETDKFSSPQTSNSRKPYWRPKRWNGPPPAEERKVRKCLRFDDDSGIRKPKSKAQHRPTFDKKYLEQCVHPNIAPREDLRLHLLSKRRIVV